MALVFQSKRVRRAEPGYGNAKSEKPGAIRLAHF